MNKVVTRAIQAVRSGPCRKMSSLNRLPELTLNRPPPKMPKNYDKILKKREIFQADNGLPIFIKGGTWDVVLYRLTFLAVVLGDLYVFTYIPQLIK